MTKSLTEKYYDGTLPSGMYYFNNGNETYPVEYRQTEPYMCSNGITVLEPVPSYKSLYNPNNGTIPTGLFTVLKIIKRDIERTQEYRDLTDLECGIKSQVVSLLKTWGVK